ncbi:MAG TPA: helix-turn-helix domain-containing protein [Steroidobacteraceae bacterium]|jgi:AcrR family transcriptional regulator|nr:helix-turn-helix domain-containing protein [Steroidobacteraceae bacterium]
MDAPARSSKRSLPFLPQKDPDATKSRILSAAFCQLSTVGYAALSMREIAKDAEVNHALINYHFRSKDQLVIAVLDEANRQLLERQQRMYLGPNTFAEKWAQARRFYQDDLASGFVRVQAELWAASFSDPTLREKFLPRLRDWHNLVLGGVREALKALEASGTKLPAPFSAEIITTWISNFWLGMEFLDLIATSRETAEHTAALNAVEKLLKQLDSNAKSASGKRRARRKAGK